MRVSITGLLVSTTSRPYDFKDDNGEQVTGTARRLYVVPEGEAPVEIKVHENDLDKYLVAEGLVGEYVTVECNVPSSAVRLNDVRPWVDDDASSAA